MSAQVLTKDWDDFNPRAYLDEYYADIGGENDALLRFYRVLICDLCQRFLALLEYINTFANFSFRVFYLKTIPHVVCQ
jgi:hypothetical protein